MSAFLARVDAAEPVAVCLMLLAVAACFAGMTLLVWWQEQRKGAR